MKKVKLTESVLHKIIKESVKSILNELDWKTYASAAQKRQQQGRDADANNLINAAETNFQNKYTLNNKNAGDFKSFGNDARLNARINKNGGTIRDERSSYNGGSFMNGKRGTETHHFGNDGSYSKKFKGERDPNMSNRSQEYLNHLNKMGNDMQNFYSGKSKYVKGKGWE